VRAGEHFFVDRNPLCLREVQTQAANRNADRLQQSVQAGRQSSQQVEPSSRQQAGGLFLFHTALLLRTALNAFDERGSSPSPQGGMEQMAGLMGGGATSNKKYADPKTQGIGDKYAQMLAQPNLSDAHRASIEKMALRRREREASQAAERDARLQASLNGAHRAAAAADVDALRLLCPSPDDTSDAATAARSLLVAPSLKGQSSVHVAAIAGSAPCLTALHDALARHCPEAFSAPDAQGDTPAHLAAAAVATDDDGDDAGADAAACLGA
jgi:hypothetical protein